jgi:hypothetical protein
MFNCLRFVLEKASLITAKNNVLKDICAKLLWHVRKDNHCLGISLGTREFARSEKNIAPTIHSHVFDVFMRHSTLKLGL